MFSQLKSNPEQFRQWLLACDSEHLTGDLLGQLNKSLPSPEEMKKLADLKSEINDLPDSEQYFCAVRSISNRLLLIHFVFLDQWYQTYTSTYHFAFIQKSIQRTTWRYRKSKNLFDRIFNWTVFFFFFLSKNLVAARQACETVRRSKRFPKLIEFVLTIGNFMNSSTKTYEPIYGFDISFLPKVNK